MKSKIFPIIFTTLLACVLFFAMSYKENEASIKFNQEKFLNEYKETFDYVYYKDGKEVTTTFNYKIVEDEEHGKIARIGVILSDDEILEGAVVPYTINDMPTEIDRFKSYTLKDLEIKTAIFGTIILTISLTFFTITTKIGNKMALAREERKRIREEKRAARQNRY